MFQNEFIRRNAGMLREDGRPAQGFRLVAMVGQEADLDRQRC